MMNNRLQTYILRKDGSVIKVQTYLFVNHQSIENIVLIFDKEVSTEENKEDNFFLADEEFEVLELSRSIQDCIGFKQKDLEAMRITKGTRAYIEDFFKPSGTF